MDSAAGYTQQQLSKLTWLHTRRSVKAHLCYTHCLFDLILSHHLSLNRKGHWGTTDDFIISFLHFSLFSTALWDLPNTRSVHSLMLSSRLFLCLPCLLPPFTMPCEMDLARPDERETWPYHCSLRLFTVVRKSLCDPTACWILARTSSLVTRSSYEMHSACSSTSFPWLVFFFGALLWGSMTHKHTGRWMWQGSTSLILGTITVCSHHPRSKIKEAVGS